MLPLTRLLNFIARLCYGYRGEGGGEAKSITTPGVVSTFFQVYVIEEYYQGITDNLSANQKTVCHFSG